MIELINVSKKYSNGIIALNNINLKIEKGEFVFIVGSTGAGKSTLIKLLLKEEEPTSGTIKIGNKDLSKLTRREVPYLRRSIGVVFQDFRLLPNKTVYENVAFAMEVIGCSEKEIRKQVPLVLSMVGLSEKAKYFPHQLSGGEQQRVSIARAIVNGPPVLIADEPTGNLDPDTSWGLMELFNEINLKGTTILMATHAKDIVDRMKKRVIALDRGVLVKDQARGVYSYEI